MLVKNNSGFKLADDLVVVTENGWIVMFYGKRFDVFLGARKIISGVDINVLETQFSVSWGIDKLTLTNQKNTIILTESISIERRS